MHGDELRRLIRAEQFRPFRLVLANGEKLSVRHVDFISLSPSGRTAIVYFGQSDDYSVLDVPLIIGVEVEERAA